jgi:hypothetical protein
MEAFGQSGICLRAVWARRHLNPALVLLPLMMLANLIQPVGIITLDCTYIACQPCNSGSYAQNLRQTTCPTRCTDCFLV